MKLATPERTSKGLQAKEALKIANQARSAQAKVYAGLRVGPRQESLIRAASMLEDPSEVVASCRLDRFLKAIHRYPYTARDRCLHHARVGPASYVRKIEALSDRQRLALASCLRAQA